MGRQWTFIGTLVSRNISNKLPHLHFLLYVPLRDPSEKQISGVIGVYSIPEADNFLELNFVTDFNAALATLQSNGAPRIVSSPQIEPIIVIVLRALL